MMRVYHPPRRPTSIFTVRDHLNAIGLAAFHGDNIWLVDRPVEFADAVVRLLSDSSLRARLGSRGWETVQERYSWERVKESLEAALFSI